MMQFHTSNADWFRNGSIQSLFAIEKKGVRTEPLLEQCNITYIIYEIYADCTL